MNVSNCRGCGRLFNAIADENICPDCRKKLEDKFQTVKAYLEEKPHASLDEVSRENNVTVKQLKQWVREERLSFSENSVEGIDCENCGRLIRTGRFCDDCKSRLAHTLMNAYPRPQAMKQDDSSRGGRRDGNRMRFL